MFAKLDALRARRVYDSRGVETIEVTLRAGDEQAQVAAPFGAPGSRGAFEASAYGTGDVADAIRAVEELVAPRLVGTDPTELAVLDAVLADIDGTPNFGRLGGNTSSSISTAAAILGARLRGVSLHQHVGSGRQLPRPLGNIIGGGAHAMGPTPDMQEHLVVATNAGSLAEAVHWNILVHEATGRLLAERDASFTGGTDDERAWAADLDDAGALEVIARATAEVGQQVGAEFRMGLDVAADRFWDPEGKVYRYDRAGLVLTPAQQLDFIVSLVERFGLGYVEDAFESTDYAGFAALTERVGDRCLVVGDDLLATDTERTSTGVRHGSMNSMIVKVNQVGTVSGARQTNDLAKSHGVATVISHRSGETDDASIAHFGVAWGCSMIKAGVTGGERLAKLNELIRIEAEAGDLAALPASLAR